MGSPEGMSGSQAPVTPRNQQLLTMWQRWRDEAGHAVPARSQFDPIDIVEMLPDMYLLDALDDGEDFYIRLWGTGLTRRTGVDATGLKVSAFGTQHTSENQSKFMTAYGQALKTQQPVWFCHRAVEFGRPQDPVELLIMPMRRHSDQADMLLNASSPLDDTALESLGNLQWTPSVSAD